MKMNRSILFFLLFFLFQLHANCQNYIGYYKIINKAEYEYYNGNYNEALKLIEKAFSKYEPLAVDYFLKAKCLSRMSLKDTSEIESLLIRSAKNNGLVQLWLKNQPFDFELSLRVKSTLSAIEDSCNKEIFDIKDSLKYFLAKDQELRKSFVGKSKIMPVDESKSLDSLRYYDIDLQTRFLSFIKRNKYCGIKNAKTNLAQTILLHLDCDLFKPYNKGLKKQLKLGNIQPFVYALMVDRLKCICNGKSYYSAYPINKCSLNVKKIKIRRDRIGLSTYFENSRFTRERTNNYVPLKF